MGINWQKYPHINGVHQWTGMYLKSANGKAVTVETKRDGSCISLLKHNDDILIFTRNQLAEPNVQIEVHNIIDKWELDQILENEFILYGELLRKGKSPAQFEVNEEPQLLIFDVYDIVGQTFLQPSVKKGLLEKFNIPMVDIIGSFIPKNVGEFRRECGRLVDEAFEQGIEGFVLKWHTSKGQQFIKAKSEHKYPHKRSKKPKSQPADDREPLEYSEVTGAIRKVHDEIMDDIFNVVIAMPLVAKAVSEEARRHNKRNDHNIFVAWSEYVRILQEERDGGELDDGFF